MLFLRSLNFKNIALISLLCLTFINSYQKPSNACSNIEKQRHILLEQAPKQDNPAEFVGKIEVKDINKNNGKIVAILLESESHSHQIGNTIAVSYNRKSLCGKKIERGDVGYIIGSFREWKLEDRKYLGVRPYLVSRDLNELDGKASQEEILIYCFDGYRDNEYIHAKGGSCLSNP